MGTGEAYLINESGVRIVVSNDKFFEEYTHITNTQGETVVGKHVEGNFLGVLTHQEDMLPDLDLKELI